MENSAQIAVLLDDLRRYGVTDALGADPFVWKGQQKPFSVQGVVVRPVAVAADHQPAAQPKPVPKLAEMSAPAKAPRRYQQDDTAPDAVSAPYVWQTGTGEDLLVVTVGARVDQSPFQGALAALFAKMMQGVGLNTDQAAVLAMPEVENRSEYSAYTALLRQKIADHKAQNVVLMGQKVADILLGAQGGFAENRGQCVQMDGKNVYTTYHPQLLLVQSFLKRMSWLDIRALRKTK